MGVECHEPSGESGGSESGDGGLKDDANSASTSAWMAAITDGDVGGDDGGGSAMDSAAMSTWSLAVAADAP